MYKVTILAIALSFCAATAFANTPVFADIDTDKDGALSAEEAAAVGIGSELFAKLDVDQNGTLSAEEYATLK